MRRAAMLLSMLIALSMCLTISAGASADAACPAGPVRAERPVHAPASDPADGPIPDPEPPESDSEPEDAEDPPSAATEPLVLSDGESVTVQDEQLAVLCDDPLAGGGEGYVNTPDAARMSAPPWGLGINGGERAVTLTGEAPVLSLVRASVTAGGWGVLDLQVSRNAALTAVDSDLHILSAKDGGMDSGWRLLGYGENAYGSGYGAYLAGGASAYFYGTSVDGATYGAVLDGAGDVYYGSSSGTVLLYNGAGLAGSVRGQGRSSSLDGVFGLMMCGDAAGVTVEDGTSIHAADAVVLYKEGSGAFTFRNARLSSDSGVLFQMMDDDNDDRIGLLTDTYGFSPVYDERNTGGGPGFPFADQNALPDSRPSDADPDALPPTAEPQHVEVSYINGLYTGNIYNGTGCSGQPGDSLAVTVGAGAVLNGDITLSSAVKAIPYAPEAAAALAPYAEELTYVFLDRTGAPCQEDQAAYIQFLRYPIGQYYLQGHVQNLPCYNGAASLDVTVAQDGAWAVKDLSTLTSLTVEDGALVYGQVQDNGDGSITVLPAAEPLEPGVYTSDTAAFAAANADEAAPAEEPLPQVVITIAGREYKLDLYEQDGVAYVRLADLIGLFFADAPAPSI